MRVLVRLVRSLRCVLAALVVGVPAIAQAAWHKAETQNFIVYGNQTVASLEEYALMLEDFDGALRRVHKMPKTGALARKLKVYLVSGPIDMQRIRPGANKNLAGFQLTSAADIYAVGMRDRMGGVDHNKGDDVVLHEYVHHFLKQYFPNAYPTWVHEGYAWYFATADIRDRQVAIGGVSPMLLRTLRGDWLPMERVVSGGMEKMSPEDVASYYAQSWLLTHYLMSDPARTAQLSTYIKALHSGEAPAAAWQRVFGQNFKQLEQTLKDYRSQPILGRIIKREDLAEKTVKITALSPAADAVLLEGQRLIVGVDEDDRPETLSRVRTAYAKWPNDRIAGLAYGRAETAYGDRVAGEAALQKLIDADAHDWEARLMMAESRRRTSGVDEAARFAEALKWYKAVLQIDPDCPQAMSGVVNMSRNLPQYPTEDHLQIVLNAVSIAPQVPQYRVQAAEILIARKAPAEEVSFLLQPLLNDAHGEGRTVEKARALIKQVSAPPGV